MVSLNAFSKKSINFLTLFAFFSLILVASATRPSAADAPPKVGPGCDPNFMAAMQRKAWMEVQREWMIAQSTIAKPDSVFALGCFGKFVNDFNGTVGFSQGNQFNVQGSVTTFVSAAFGHAYGGGHVSGAGENKGDNVSCGIIADIWNKARCSNFDLVGNQLFTLQDISGYNRGTFPKACDPPSPNPWGSTGDTTTPLGLYYGAKTNGKSMNAVFDDMSLFTDVVAPVSETSSKKCAPGIPTGVSISSGGKEIVCSNPGCISDGKENPKCCGMSVSDGKVTIDTSKCSS